MVVSSEVAQCVQDVKSDTTATDWALFGLVGRVLRPLEKGTGGHGELIKRFKTNAILYAFLRTITGDLESRRTKFVLMTWIGPEASMLAKGRASALKSELLPAVGQYHIEITTDDLHDVSIDAIGRRLKVAGGADYDTGSNAGGYKGEGAKKIKSRAIEAFTGRATARPTHLGKGKGGAAETRKAARKFSSEIQNKNKPQNASVPPSTVAANANLPTTQSNSLANKNSVREQSGMERKNSAEHTGRSSSFVSAMEMFNNIKISPGKAGENLATGDNYENMASSSDNSADNGGKCHTDHPTEDRRERESLAETNSISADSDILANRVTSKHHVTMTEAAPIA